MNSGGGQAGRGLVWFDRFPGRPDRPSARLVPRPAGSRALDSWLRPGYPHFVMGRGDLEPEASAFMPRVKSKFLSFGFGIRIPGPGGDGGAHQNRTGPVSMWMKSEAL